MKKQEETWEDFEKTLNITPEDEEEIRLEMEIIEATIKAREKNKLSQTELSKITGIKQSAIARIENHANSPQIDTLIKILNSLGYTIQIVPIQEAKNRQE